MSHEKYHTIICENSWLAQKHPGLYLEKNMISFKEPIAHSSECTPSIGGRKMSYIRFNVS